MLPIYYINLDRRPDRREHIEAQLASCGLSGERVSAATISGIPPDILEHHGNPRKPVALSPSQLACSLSHLEVWRRFLATQAEWALILEDDAVLSPRLAEFLTSFETSPAARSLDLVHIEAMARRARVLPVAERIGSIALRPYCSTQWGSAAYLVSRKAAGFLLECDDIFSGPIDRVLFRPYASPGRHLRMMLADPALSIQLDKLEANAVASGNLTPMIAGTKPPLTTRLARWWAHLGSFLASVRYLRRHRRQGISVEIIPFGTPGRTYSGSKSASYGAEIVD